MDTKQDESSLPSPSEPSPTEEVPVKKESDKVEIRKRFRLYENPSRHFCLFFSDICQNYPATSVILEHWNVAERPAEHKINGVPCIVDLQSSDVWLGSQCLHWLRRAVIASAQQIPLAMPRGDYLKRKYSSPSTEDTSTEISSPTISPEIDINQEETLQQDSSPPPEETQKSESN